MYIWLNNLENFRFCFVCIGHKPTETHVRQTQPKTNNLQDPLKIIAIQRVEEISTRSGYWRIIIRYRYRTFHLCRSWRWINTKAVQVKVLLHPTQDNNKQAKVEVDVSTDLILMMVNDLQLQQQSFILGLMSSFPLAPSTLYLYFKFLSKSSQDFPSLHLPFLTWESLSHIAFPNRNIYMSSFLCLQFHK